MQYSCQERPRWVIPVSIFAVLFGLLTLKEGASVLFIDGSARRAAGNYVPFVLWFNFCSGFAYIAAGIGLWQMQKWSAQLAAFIAVAILLVFAAFGVHAFIGGAYELRTVVAMILRSTIWVGIALKVRSFFAQTQ